MYALPARSHLWEEGKLITFFLAILVAFFQDGDGTKHASGFATALQEASRRNVPVIVFVHGSDWNQLGERLMSGMWIPSQNSTELMSLDLVLTDIDMLQSFTPEEKTEHNARHAGWKKQGLVTYPALIALAPDGSVFGSRQGETLPRSIVESRAALEELAQASIQRMVLQDAILAARTQGDVAAEIDAIHEMFDLPLNKPKTLIDRLKEIDPDDHSGIRRRQALPPWHALIAQATKDAKEGRSEEVLERLELLLEDDSYDDSQQSWIHVAIGNVYRQTPEKEEQASAAFKRAWEIDRDGIAGNAGKRWYLRFHSDPSLLFGWLPQHCSEEATEWKIEDLPHGLESGTYTLAFEKTKGPHALEIARVELVDTTTGLVLESERDDSVAHGEKANQIYVMTIQKPVVSGHLRISCKSNGGTNSTGSITFTGPGDGAS